MIGRVIITSVQKGLSDGPGFQPVVRTKTLEKPVVDYVLHETGYSHPFPPGDSRNPTIYSHRIATIHGKLKHFLIRTDDAISDYSGRSNRLSQCIVIDDSDLDSTQPGPCEILMGFPWETSWTDDKKPFLETVCPPWKIIDQPTPPCLAWQKATADAGWAGTLSLSVGQQQKAVIVAGPEHDVLALFREALALLPVQTRWRVTFSSCELDISGAMWKAVRRDINSKNSSSDSDLVLELKKIKDRQQKAPESQLSARARGETPKPAQKPVTHEREQSHTATEKTQRISRGIRNPADKKIRALQGGGGDLFRKTSVHSDTHTNTSNPRGQDVFHSRHHYERRKTILIILVVVLLGVIFMERIYRERFSNGGWLNEVHVSNLSNTPKSFNPNRKPIYNTILPDQTASSNGPKEKPPQEQTTNQHAALKQEQMLEDGTKSDPEKNSRKEKNVATEKGNTEDSPRQSSSKEIEDALKNLMAANRQCSLPTIGLDDPQPIGVPWPVAFSQRAIDIAISNDDLANFNVDYQKKTKTWKVSEERASVTGTARIPIAEVSQQNEMLSWKWTAANTQKTATAMLFSRLSFPEIELEKPFIFRHAVGAKTETFTLLNCIRDERDSLAKGQSLEIDDSFFLNGHSKNKNQLSLSWNGLRDNDRLWEQVKLRMRLVSQSFKLADDVNPLDIKEILNRQSPNTIKTIWTNEHLLQQNFCGLTAQPTIEVNIYNNGKGGWSASFTLKAKFIDGNKITNTSLANFLSDVLNSDNKASLDIDTLFKDHNYLKNYLSFIINQSDKRKNLKVAEDAWNILKIDTERKSDGSNGPGGALPGQLTPKEYADLWPQAKRKEVKNEYAAAAKALKNYRSNLYEEQKDILKEIIHDLEELRCESFDVTITCGLDSSDSKAGGDFDIPLVGTK